MSTRRAGRAELRRKSTKESGVVHRIPAGAPRSTGARPATGEGIIPAAATARRRRGGPGKIDVQTDGCADVQRVRRDHSYGRWERSGGDVQDRRYCAERGRVAVICQAALVFPRRRRRRREAPPPMPLKRSPEGPDNADACRRRRGCECRSCCRH